MLARDVHDHPACRLRREVCMDTRIGRLVVPKPESDIRKRHRGLDVFVQYSVLRIERDHEEENEPWSVTISRQPNVGVASSIAIHPSGVVLVETGTGDDDATATWDAMCRIEQRIRSVDR
jgi:hypothetical protein